MIVDDPTLGAFVDGELEPDAAARIEAEAAADPALAARIAQARALRAAIATAFDDVIAEPPPERLLAAVRGGEGTSSDVISLAERRTRLRPRFTATAARWAGLAASLAIFTAGGYLLAPRLPPGPIATRADGALTARGLLATGLERQLAAAQAPDAPVRIGVSFQAGDGRYCRTFVLRQGAPVAGLACREPAGWRVVMAMQPETPAGAAGGYQTASGAVPAPVMDEVDRTIRGRPLDAAAEQRARDAGWGAR